MLFLPSELTHYKPGFQRLGPFRPCFESSEPEWPPCYRTTSTHDLSWDGERPPRSPDPPPEPLHRPLRGRAFSESHLNLEPSSPRARKDFLRVQSEAPGLPKKKGPPPPRPPPPNWEQYRLRRASQHPKNGSGSGTAPPPSRSIAEAVRQRTRSLAAETPPGRPRGTPEPEAELCRWALWGPQGHLLTFGDWGPHRPLEDGVSISATWFGWDAGGSLVGGLQMGRGSLTSPFPPCMSPCGDVPTTVSTGSGKSAQYRRTPGSRRTPPKGSAGAGSGAGPASALCPLPAPWALQGDPIPAALRSPTPGEGGPNPAA